MERKDARDVIGYCGLTDNDNVPRGEPELAFETERREVDAVSGVRMYATLTL